MKNIIMLMLLTGCGVNTGNPGGVSPKPNATFIIDIPQLASGKLLEMKVSGVEFVGQGYKISVPLNRAVTLQSGKKTSLVPRVSLPEGQYLSMNLVLQDSQSVQYYDQDVVQPVYVPPVSLLGYSNREMQLQNSEQEQYKLIMRNYQNTIDIHHTSSVVTVEYDFSRQISALSETQSAIRDYFVEQEVAADALVFSSFLDDVQFSEREVSSFEEAAEIVIYEGEFEDISEEESLWWASEHDGVFVEAMPSEVVVIDNENEVIELEGELIFTFANHDPQKVVCLFKEDVYTDAVSIKNSNWCPQAESVMFVGKDEIFDLLLEQGMYILVIAEESGDVVWKETVDLTQAASYIGVFDDKQYRNYP